MNAEHKLASIISLPDLIRSKETVRESDWRDVDLLEEILDARNLAAFNGGRLPLINLLSNLRTRIGMNKAVEQKLTCDPASVVVSMGLANHPVPFTFLAPFAPGTSQTAPTIQLDSTVAQSIFSVEAGSSRHFALIEIVRRTYRRHAVEVDRMDKQTHLDDNRKPVNKDS